MTQLTFYYRAEVEPTFDGESFWSSEREDWRIGYVPWLVVKTTRCGVWLQRYFEHYGASGKKRFVCNDSIKKFAYPTKEEALYGFIRRKKRHIEIMETQLTIAKIGYALAKELREKGDPK